MKGAVVLLGVASIAAVAAASPPLAAHGAGVDEIAGYRLIAASEARRTGVPQQIVDAVMRVESGYDPMASGDAGEIGLMQILPGTAAMLGFRGTMAELREPHTNIRLRHRLSGASLAARRRRPLHHRHEIPRRPWRDPLLLPLGRILPADQAYLATLGFPAEGALPPATFGVPVPVLTDVAFTADATARGPVKKKEGGLLPPRCPGRQALRRLHLEGEFRCDGTAERLGGPTGDRPDAHGPRSATLPWSSAARPSKAAMTLFITRSKLAVINSCSMRLRSS